MGFVRRPHVGDFTAAQLEKCKKSERDAAAEVKKRERTDGIHIYTRARKAWKENYESTEKISSQRERERERDVERKQAV
jgi:hypothetical protein